MTEDWLQQASDWLVEETLKGTRPDRLVRGFCQRLSQGGVGLVRM